MLKHRIIFPLENISRLSNRLSMHVCVQYGIPLGIVLNPHQHSELSPQEKQHFPVSFRGHVC